MTNQTDVTACAACGYVSLLVDGVLVTKTVPCPAHAGQPAPVTLERIEMPAMPRRRLISRLSLV